MSDGVGVSLTTQIEDGVSAELARLARAIKAIDPALEEIGSSLATEVQMRFERQEDPEGKRWKTLSDVTLAARAAKVRGNRESKPKILREGGDLYEGASTYKVLAGEAVILGSNRPYARIHQFGGQAGRGLKVTIPARPYLGMSEDGRKEIIEILQDHIARAS